MTNLSPQVVRLEHFLDHVLRKDLNVALEKRDSLYGVASQCTQLKRTLQEMSLLHLATNPPRTEAVAANDVPSPRNKLKVLVDIGCHFRMEAQLRDPERIFLNVGCGVLVDMATTGAATFLVKKERLMMVLAQKQTEEANRVRFRIRLVMEAVTRLQAQQLADPNK